LVTSEAQCRTRNGEFAMCWSVCCATWQARGARDV
jgi:hypothetical protein